jgi:hypothetical protein
MNSDAAQTSPDLPAATSMDLQRNPAVVCSEWLECVEEIKREAALMTPEELRQPLNKIKTMRQLRVAGLYFAALLLAVSEPKDKHSNVRTHLRGE